MQRCYGKLKQFRAVAACHDKREIIYQDTIDLGHRSGSGYEIPLHDLRDTL
jgi:hypothetical protein